MAIDPLTPSERLKEDWRLFRQFVGMVFAIPRRIISMEIWREVFKLEFVLGWSFIAFIAATGISILGLEAFFHVQSLTYAEVFFIVTTILLLARFAWIAIAKDFPFWERAIFTFVLFGLVGVGIVELIRIIERRRPPTDVGTEKIESNAQTSAQPKTLHEFYVADCKGEGAFQVRGTRWLTSGDNPRAYQIEYMICADFISKSMYVSFYLPESDYTPSACKFLPALYSDILSKERGHGGNLLSAGIVQQRPGEKEDNAADIKPTGRVFVYHESYMLPSRIDELSELYKKTGLDPQFRGRDYLVMRTSPLYPESSRPDPNTSPQPPAGQSRLEILFNRNLGGCVDKFRGWSLDRRELVDYELYRVALRSASTAFGTRLGVVNLTLKGSGRHYPSLFLRIMGDPEATEFKLHPDIPQFWDVVDKPVGSDWMRLTHIVKSAGEIIFQAPQELMITASCDEGMPVRKLLKLDVDRENNNSLTFELVDS